MSKPKNPPAFPSHGSMGEVEQEGMTLLDYFAAKILQGLMANAARYNYIGKLLKDGMEHDEATRKNVNKAYVMAKAMLKEREKHIK